jgi:hypothetical protein
VDDTFGTECLENISNPVRGVGDSFTPTRFAKFPLPPFPDANQWPGQSLWRILGCLHHEATDTSLHIGSTNRIIRDVGEFSILNVSKKGTSTPTVFVTTDWYSFYHKIFSYPQTFQRLFFVQNFLKQSFFAQLLQHKALQHFQRSFRLWQ